MGILDPVLVVRNLTKRFENKDENQVIFDQLSFDLLPQTILAILGPSGCGKSTLLKILAGLVSHQGGEINWSKAYTPIKLGYIPQQASLMPNLTTLKNCLFLEQFAPSLKFNQERVESLLRKVGLGDCLGYYPNQLSGGMKQKVALVRALLLEPDVLLMDEPFSAIDEMVRWQCDFDLVRLVSEQSTTIIFVTHNVEEAVAIADRVICLAFDKPTSIMGDVRIQFSTTRDYALLRSPCYWEKVNELRDLISKGICND